MRESNYTVPYVKMPVNTFSNILYSDSNYSHNMSIINDFFHLKILHTYGQPLTCVTHRRGIKRGGGQQEYSAM